MKEIIKPSNEFLQNYHGEEPNTNWDKKLVNTAIRRANETNYCKWNNETLIEKLGLSYDDFDKLWITNDGTQVLEFRKIIERCTFDNCGISTKYLLFGIDYLGMGIPIYYRCLEHIKLHEKGDYDTVNPYYNKSLE